MFPVEILEIFNYSLDYYYVKDRKGTFVHANDRLLTLFRCGKVKDLQGKTDYDFVPSYLADRYAREEKRVYDRGETIPNKIELLSRDGIESFWHITTKIPWRDETGKVVGLIGVTRDLHRDKEIPRPENELDGVLNYLKDHYMEKVKVADLAQVANLSLSAFERRFKKVFGMTPLAYLKTVRLNAACRLLSESNRPLSQVASDCGFCDQSYFTSEFAKAMEVSPGQYRKRYF